MFLSDQSEVRFVNERGGLERVIPALMPQIADGSAPEFAVDERQQVIARLDIAEGPRPQQTTHPIGGFSHSSGSAVPTVMLLRLSVDQHDIAIFPGSIEYDPLPRGRHVDGAHGSVAH